MSEKRGFNCDHDGNPSTMRWLSFMLGTGALLMGANEAALMWSDKQDNGDPMLMIYLLAAAVGGKVGQKVLEMKHPPKPQHEDH